VNKLPSGWATVALSDIADVLRGVTYKKADATASPTTGFLPILRATNINGDLNLDSEMVYVPERYVRPEQRMRVGDIIVATSSGSANVVGKSAQLRSEWQGGFGAFCSVIRPSSLLARGFIGYFVASPQVRETWYALAKGTNINNLKSSDLSTTAVPLPPMEEQKRIVQAIEEQFSRLDAGLAALELAGQKLKKLRAAVLQAAVIGTLLLDPGPIVTRSLGGTLSFLDQGKSPKCENRASDSEDEWAVIKTTAVQAMRFDPSANKVLPPNIEPRADYELVPGDLLITRAGPRVRAGVCCLVRQVRPRLMICDKVYRFRPDRDVLIPEYLEIALNAPSVTSRIDQIKTGISDSGVNITQRTFGELQIPIPTIKTQSLIVDVVQAYLTRIDQLERYLSIANTRGRQLRSSVLSAAFSGKLARQDPTDEPAPAVLEIIAAEREVLNGDKPASSRAPQEPRNPRTLGRVTP
jgi:type I restriction enzyme, S subunit